MSDIPNEPFSAFAVTLVRIFVRLVESAIDITRFVVRR